MKRRLSLLVPLLSASVALGQGADTAAPPPPPPEEQPEVMARGPVHEAFAEPVSLQMQDGLVAPRPPPPDIEELPPAEKPVGDQYAWVSGYWSWDAERSDWVWVSACWRAAPPNMSWVPGYWTPVPGGVEWVAGFWSPAGGRELEYLPAPPALENVQAPGMSPSPDSIWVSPCWYWHGGRYVMRQGYWLTAQPDWLWVPSHYVWTPRGYIFVAGHWDYPLERRGTLFAPVYFSPSFRAQVGFTFSPSLVVDLAMLTTSLFACPRYGHYYFGDYYDESYVDSGIFPWFDCERLHTWYDPVWEYHRWDHRRSEPRWEEQERHDYEARRADRELRPSRTLVETQPRAAAPAESHRRPASIVRSLEASIHVKTDVVKYQPIGDDARHRIAHEAADTHHFGEERHRWESAGAPPPVERGGHGASPASVATRDRVPAVPTEHDGRDKGSDRVIDRARDSGGSPADHRGSAPVPRQGDRKDREAAATKEDHPGTVAAPPAQTRSPDRPAKFTEVKDSDRPPRVIDTKESDKPSKSADVVKDSEKPSRRGDARDREGAATPAPRDTTTAQPPVERRGHAAPADAPSPGKFVAAPPREVRATQPERVSIPAVPSRGRSGPAEGAVRSVPPKPAEEAKSKGDSKDAGDSKDSKDSKDSRRDRDSR